MEFLELVKKRHSTRSYRPEKVEKEKVSYILECARIISWSAPGWHPPL